MASGRSRSPSRSAARPGATRSAGPGGKNAGAGLTGSKRAAAGAPAPVGETLRRLRAFYPDVHHLLRFDDAFQLLVATILAAQARDERINQVTPHVFARWGDARALARAPVEEVEEVVRPTGFYRQKARRLVEVARGLVERFGGEVPSTVEELTSLPGVGKKTAIAVINHAFDLPAGVAVDTHVLRVSGRLGWSRAQDPDHVEEELRALLPRREWIGVQDLLACHGRALCRAPRPRCRGCPIEELCPYLEKVFG